MSVMFTEAESLFSADKKYRYCLECAWESEPGTLFPDDRLTFVGFNPSVTNDIKFDSTVRRCVEFSRSWGYRRLVIVNLFHYRATNPLDLKRVLDPVGTSRHNERCSLKLVFQESREILLGWGPHGSFLGKAEEFRNLLRAWEFQDRCRMFYLTRSGEPAHFMAVPKRAKRFPVWMPNGDPVTHVRRAVLTPMIKPAPKPKRPSRSLKNLTGMAKNFQARTALYVYVVEPKGLDVTDSVVVKRYALLQKRKRSVVVVVKGSPEIIRKTSRNAIFTDEDSLHTYLTNWLKNRQAALEKSMSLVRQYRSMEQEKLLRAIVTNTKV